MLGAATAPCAVAGRTSVTLSRVAYGTMYTNISRSLGRVAGRGLRQLSLRTERNAWVGRSDGADRLIPAKNSRPEGRSPYTRHLSAAANDFTVRAEETGKTKTKQPKQQQTGGGGQKGAGGEKSGKAPAQTQTQTSAITPRGENFSRWYLDVIRECELADYGPVRGTMVIRPYGYALWEKIQEWMDKKFKATGHSNAYFPQFIPYSFIEKEASHVEGFSPELALVTKAGGKDLEEPLVVRPTSETIVNHMFAQWVQSYRDLPLLINQWANVTRWELKTRPFIRTLEFLWQEGHTAHATASEAEEEARKMIGVYEEFARTQAALPVVAGRKSRRESFAGADVTYTIEAMMGDGRALQAGTSHNLGQNFARAFNTQFLDEDGTHKLVHQTSWGVSTRMVGGIIMAHGDDTGLRLPPQLAPVQVVVIPILRKAEDTEAVLAACHKVVATLAEGSVRVKLDADEKRTPGWKYNFWEMKGVPLRVEIGPRDVASNVVVTARRDMPGKEGKEMGVPMESAPLLAHVRSRLDAIQATYLQQAIAFRDSNIVDVTTYDELKAVIADGKWARCGWAASDADELRIKEETMATIRCFPFDQPKGEKRCLMTGGPAQEVCIFAKSY
eukprot:jgi/Mesvir1/10099/Mv06972-RA.1